MANREVKAERYRRIFAQAQELVSEVRHPIARMSTVVALLHHKMPGFSWTGFYLLDGENLVVGPYQGLLACLALEKNTGVCWAGILRGEPVIVPDVHAFPGHIACDTRSRSEIVVPVRRGDGSIAGVLDVDSTRPSWFDATDAEGLTSLAKLIHPGAG
jgi:L-methionine (R)-S-oxide reductase